MSTHPNAILLGILIPDDLSRKTYRAILDQHGADHEYANVKIGKRDYKVQVMEDSYNDGYQISAPEGSIIVHDYLTYGYGENIPWEDVEFAKDELDTWLRDTAQRNKCSYSIHITANYW